MAPVIAVAGVVNVLAIRVWPSGSAIRMAANTG